MPNETATGVPRPTPDDGPSMPEQVMKFAARIRYLLRYEGPWTTYKVVLAELAHLVRLPILAGYRYHSYYDAKTGLATAGNIPPQDLDFEAERRDHSSRYSPTPPPIVRHVLSRLDIPFERFTFVDLGSGMGRVLLLAAEWPFARIIGVELSPSLHQRAVQNIAAYRDAAGSDRDIESVCMDVTAFRKPDGPTVLYLFNPFDSSIFSQVLHNLRDALVAHPERTFLVYYNCSPDDRALIDELGLFRLVTSGSFDQADWSIHEYDPTHVPGLST